MVYILVWVCLSGSLIPAFMFCMKVTVAVAVAVVVVVIIIIVVVVVVFALLQSICIVANFWLKLFLFCTTSLTYLLLLLFFLLLPPTESTAVPDDCHVLSHRLSGDQLCPCPGED